MEGLRQGGTIVIALDNSEAELLMNGLIHLATHLKDEESGMLDRFYDLVLELWEE